MIPAGLTSAPSFNRHDLIRAARSYYPKKWLPSVRAIFFDWILIISTVFASWLYAPPIVWPIAMLIVASRQHALLVLMHDAAHHNLLPNRTWNEAVSDFFLAWPHLISTKNYRTSHFAHHRWLGTTKDPDLSRKLHQLGAHRFWIFPKSRKEIIKNILLDLLGWGAFAQFQRLLYFRKQKAGTYSEEPTNQSRPNHSIRGHILRLAYYAVLLLIAIWTNTWLIVLLFWIIPIFTFLPALLRVRSYAEHFNVTGTNELNSTRNIYAGHIESFLFGPHNVGHHITHHLYPQIPFYSLPNMSRHLEDNYGFRLNRIAAHGYLLGSNGTILNQLSTEPLLSANLNSSGNYP